MVHFKPAAAEFNIDTDYWKLKSCVNRYNLANLDPSLFDRQREVESREERGLLVYETCTNTELGKFLSDRKIWNTQSAGELTRDDMIELLEEDDEHPSTTGDFFSLPAEMRNSVAEYYLESFQGEGLDSYMASPPLAQVNRQMRKEVLPMFQAMCRPTFRIDYTLGDEDRIRWKTSTALSFKSANAKISRHNPGKEVPLRANLFTYEKGLEGRTLLLQSRWLMTHESVGDVWKLEDKCPEWVQEVSEGHRCCAELRDWLNENMSISIRGDIDGGLDFSNQYFLAIAAEWIEGAEEGTTSICDVCWSDDDGEDDDKKDASYRGR